jgi:hypothetical protein
VTDVYLRNAPRCRERATGEEGHMNAETKAAGWVVYTVTDLKLGGGMKVVCEQGEWDEMERARPGRHSLVREGIMCESEAEKLARGTSGDALRSSRARRR